MRISFRLALLVAVLVSMVLAAPLRAIDVTPPPVEPPKTTSPILLTQYSLSKTQLVYVQLHNSSDEVVDLENWKLQVLSQDETLLFELSLDGLIKPGGYIVLADELVIPSADAVFTGVELSQEPARLAVEPVTMYRTHEVAVDAKAVPSFWRRTISETTGKYLSSFTEFTPGDSFVLYGQGFYEIPSAPGVLVTEILANPRHCSPLETAGECRDYIKLYNPTMTPIDLSLYRLRVGYQGQNPTESNTFQLVGILPPGQFSLLQQSADNRPISLTNSGAFVWLEDAYGIERYDVTILEYPDASAENKKGQAWAYDEADDTWKWTTQPTPYNAPSVFPVAIDPPKAFQSARLAPCREDQYRSEETYRCRNIATAQAMLTPCREDQYRSEETNRCRSLASTAAAELQPCKEGQERNPDTNRCRNVTSNSPPAAAFSVEPIHDTAQAFTGWWAVGGVSTLAAGYGAWEWRRELTMLLQKALQFFISSK